MADAPRASTSRSLVPMLRPAQGLRDLAQRATGLARDSVGFAVGTSVGVVEEVTRRVVPWIIDLLPIDEVVDALPIERIIERVDIGALLQRVDIGALIERVDIDALIQRVDVAALVDRVDVSHIMESVDIVPIAQEVVAEVDIGSIVRESTGTITGDAIDSVRVSAMRVDGFAERIADRVLFRRKPRKLAVEGYDIEAPEAPEEST